ncbi:MAG: hypothetical protein C0524_12335 [Rhodobacter sp.]|nr:hypothetical protein [Rhodobacter sp.]
MENEGVGQDRCSHTPRLCPVLLTKVGRNLGHGCGEGCCDLIEDSRRFRNTSNEVVHSVFY